MRIAELGGRELMNCEWRKVKEFHKRFGHPVSDRPVMLGAERVKVRRLWMLEELQEFAEAADIVEQADAMLDLIYFALGTMVEMGIEPEEIFNIVHEANMSKLWEDGMPHYNEDGKTKKPETWEDPYMRLKAALEGSG